LDQPLGTTSGKSGVDMSTPWRRPWHRVASEGVAATVSHSFESNVQIICVTGNYSSEVCWRFQWFLKLVKFTKQVIFVITV